MGWAWATYFIQHAGLRLFVAPQNSGSWIFDKAPGQAFPHTGCLRAFYIDNFVAMSRDPDEAQRTIDGMANAFQASGMVTTRDPVQEDAPEFLGFEFDAHTCVLR
eukprot:2545629-Alexandrium_andersonii.AAC.1